MNRSHSRARFVAYIEHNHQEQGPDSVVVRGIPSGRVIHRATPRVAPVHKTLLEEARVRGLAVTAKRSLGWVQEDWFATHAGGEAPPVEYAIYAIDRTGFHTLAAQLASEPASLKFRGSVLSWTEDGTPHSTALE